MNTKNILRMVMALVLVAAVVVALTVLPVKDYLAGFLDRIESVGPWGKKGSSSFCLHSPNCFTPNVNLSIRSRPRKREFFVRRQSDQHTDNHTRFPTNQETRAQYP